MQKVVVSIYFVTGCSYIGDGDTNSYREVVIQKRVVGHLRKLKSSDKAPLSDGKSLSGKGRLTERMINKLQMFLE